MNILLLVPDRMTWPGKIQDINSFTSMWAYYLHDSLSKIATCDVLKVPDPSGSKNSTDDVMKVLMEIDTRRYHGIIALGLRFFSYIPKEQALPFVQSTRAAVAQIYDGSRLDNDAVDVTFTFRDDAWRYPLGSTNNRYQRHRDNNVYVGWAADHELLQPRQPTDELNILVDHSAFDHHTSDRSLDTLFNIQALLRSDVWKKSYKKVSVRRIVSGQVETVDPNNFSVTVYDRNHIDYIKIAEEYRRAHIFCVTHLESVGQVVIECATAGALILAPKGFIAADRLETVRNIEWERTVDWPTVLDAIDPQASRQKALDNSWKNIARNISSTLYQIHKRKKSGSIK